jgi:hypothetical protein
MALETFTKPKTFETRFILGCFQYNVKITTPDLRSNASDCWGDWGPMYTVFLSGEQSIDLEYRSLSRGLEASYRIRPKVVEFTSPFFARDRERFPLCLEFEDEARELRYLAYLSPDGSVAHAEVETLYPEHDFDRLIFPSAQLGQKSA